MKKQQQFREMSPVHEQCVHWELSIKAPQQFDFINVSVLSPKARQTHTLCIYNNDKLLPVVLFSIYIHDLYHVICVLGWLSTSVNANSPQWLLPLTVHYITATSNVFRPNTGGECFFLIIFFSGLISSKYGIFPLKILNNHN